MVPGARRDEIAGMLGDRLKIRVSAPPEDGKANAAVCRLIADSLGLKHRQVTIRTGHGNPEKTVEIHGMDDQQVRAILALHEKPG
ncbi:MAG: hypothetical protein GIKADHBN_02730 [Phycisphaerales bacterium]|nr:hypothetical protein [Phycisphaerales bacterium]